MAAMWGTSLRAAPDVPLPSRPGTFSLRPMEDVGVSFYINWLSVPFFFVPALAIALYGAHVSGGFMRPGSA